MEGSGNNDLVILSLIMAGFYFAGLYKMGFKAGMLWVVGTVLLFAFMWPFGGCSRARNRRPRAAPELPAQAATE